MSGAQDAIGVHTRLVTTACAALALLTACSTGDYRDAPTDVPPAERTSAARCARDASVFDATSHGSIPKDFAAEAVVRCTIPGTIVQLPRVDRYAVVEDTAGSTPELVQALGLPDQEFVSSRSVCPASGGSAFGLILVDAKQQAINVRLPEDPCSDPRTEVIAR